MSISCECSTLHLVAAYRLIQYLPREKQAMEKRNACPGTLRVRELSPSDPLVGVNAYWAHMG